MSKDNISLIPLGSRVLVECPEQQEMTSTGIYVPESAKKDKNYRGQVIAVGDGRISDDGKRLPMSVAVGDKILFSNYSAEEIEVDGKTLFLVEESSIMAKITS